LIPFHMPDAMSSAGRGDTSFRWRQRELSICFGVWPVSVARRWHGLAMRWPRVLLIACVFQVCVAAAPAQAAWDRFQIIEWQRRDIPRLKALRALGVTAVAVIADRDGTGTPLPIQTAAPKAVGLRWYVENVATDFYAPYHRYTPGKPVNWLFLAAQARYLANPNDDTALYRDPSLLDTAWRKRIADRLTATVRTEKSFHPLYYSLGDETGIADLSAYWDFDLSPVSIAGYRTWLHGQYGSLAALNTEWGTSYATWSAVRPETTRAAMRRKGNNFAAWNDFKAWMDTQFADALRFGTDAIHRADPTALSAIEGAQIPGWGGYDYTKLANAVDVMEIYDWGENLAIARSLNPRLIPVVTSFQASPDEFHRIWTEVLRGARGLILWDDNNSIVRQDASLAPRGAAYAPLFAALRGRIGRVMMEAHPVYDDVAVLYSPVSFRVRWMLDHRGAGDAWMHGSAEGADADDPYRASLRGFTDALTRMGLRPRFISPEQLAKSPPAGGALILPHVIALSDQDVRSVRAFLARGGRVLADTPPGLFDGHGRRRTVAPLNVTLVAPDDLATSLPNHPLFAVKGDSGAVDAHLFRVRGHYLLALQQHATGKTPQRVTVRLHGWSARDVVTGKPLGPDGTLTVDPVTPTFLEMRER
jgi:Beta-galactosidase